METEFRQINYAAFIMTYKRPAILLDTIMALMSQTRPPVRILIVDNDPEQSAKKIADSLSDINIKYFPTGYNSGPAGAAYWGCKLLYEEGWEWILWVDDDDPPRFPNQVETLINIIHNSPNPDKIGMVGSVGVKFDFMRGITKRIPNKDATGLIPVDMVAGGQFPLISRPVFEKNVFPSPDLFFGFEELDFGLKVKKAGFDILILGDELVRHRTFANRMEYQRPLFIKKKTTSLWREYYSIRNLIWLLSNEKAWIGLLRVILKSVIKGIWQSLAGMPKGLKHFKYFYFGILDGLRGKLGIRYLPQPKH